MSSDNYYEPETSTDRSHPHYEPYEPTADRHEACRKMIKSRDAEIERLQAALATAEHQVQSHAELLNEFAGHVQRAKQERDECRSLLREAVKYEQEFLPSEWCQRAAAAAGGEG